MNDKPNTPNMPNMPNMDSIMEQAKKMQEQMQAAQNALAKKIVVGEAGGGMVKVTMTGRHDVKEVELDPDLAEEDLEMMADLFAAATNDAVRKVEKAAREKMTALTSGLGLPPGFELPDGDS